MTAPETLTLPRSGVVLKYNQAMVYAGGFNSLLGCGIVIEFYGHPYHEAFLGVTIHRGIREERIAWLDAKILALRTALLPADARELIAQALWTHDEWNPHTLAEADRDSAAKIRAGAAIYRAKADAVLAALGAP